MARTPTMHWTNPNPFKKNGVTPAFFGIKYANDTPNKEKVTCRNCIRQMKLHGHLPEEQQPDLTRIQGEE